MGLAFRVDIALESCNAAELAALRGLDLGPVLGFGSLGVSSWVDSQTAEVRADRTARTILY